MMVRITKSYGPYKAGSVYPERMIDRSWMALLRYNGCIENFDETARPTSAWAKGDIAKWLNDRNIPFDPVSTKKELLQLCGTLIKP